jgi:uncharacterized RDD family membrane protein YckC
MWPFRKRGEPKPPRSLRRSFVTPEGVDLRLELGGAGARAAAFLIDAVLMLVILILVTIAIAYLLEGSKSEILEILWLVGFFVLRNGWFILFEISGRGATPGKMALGLRVVARDGAPLTGGAVIARNAMREIEIFLPLSFLGFQAGHDAADAFQAIFALLWSGIFLFFPLMNRDRLRVGDLVGGTWVCRPCGPSSPPISARTRRSRGHAAASATPRSICTASMNCRRWKKCSGSAGPTRSRPWRRRCGARRTCPTTATIWASSPIIIALCACGWNAA